DASNPDIVMTTTLNNYSPDANIYRSTDGGKTWNAFWDLDENNTKKDNYTINYSDAPWLDWGKKGEAPQTSPKLGWMLGDIKIDPFDSNHIVYGTGATLYTSRDVSNLDKGRRVNIELQITGVEETAVIDLVSLPSGDARLISGLADIGGFVHTDINKAPSMPVNPEISNCTSIDYAELSPERIVRVGDLGVVGLSIDGGKKWSEISKGLKIVGEGGHYMESGGSVAMSSDGKTIVYSPNIEGSSVFYTHNDGETWYPANGIPSKAKVVSDRVNPEIVYGMINGDFYISRDSGENFEKTTSGLYTGSPDINVMPGVEGDIWFAGDGIWHSTDYGKTFEKLPNIEKAPIMGFGKAAPGKDYMSIFIKASINGVTGVYRSDDKGTSWVRVNDDNHQYGAANSTLTGDKRVYGRFYLGTNGRGIICGELAE
ncbi:MAG: xyloglucanase, partial [Clostridium sp.]|nr:xyloglucanase [Clostridium sp.]